MISNSSPIIVLGKQGLLGILKECFDKILIPKEVYNEIMIEKGGVEALALKRAINEKWILIEEIEVNSVLDSESLGKGEKEAISLACKKKSTLLIDDNNARKYAALLGVECHGTLYVLYLAFLRRIIDKERARKILESIIREGFYVSTDVYARFLEMLEMKG